MRTQTLVGVLNVAVPIVTLMTSTARGAAVLLSVRKQAIRVAGRKLNALLDVTCTARRDFRTDETYI